jgi:hypothetical protein
LSITVDGLGAMWETPFMWDALPDPETEEVPKKSCF